MIESISLIQTIILLDEREVVKNQPTFKSPKLEYFERTEKNLAQANELARQILERELHTLQSHPNEMNEKNEVAKEFIGRALKKS